LNTQATNRRGLTRLLVSTINAREEEFARLSRILHDDVGQVLSAVGLQLDVLKLDFKQTVPAIVERVDEIQRMLDQAVQHVRTMSYDLNPAVVERAGLHFALDRLVGRFREQSQANIRLLYDASIRPPLAVGNAWYKIAEHALENSIRHSKSSKIEVQVRGGVKSALLEVRDNGCGFAVKETLQDAAGLGLLLMQHYARSAGLSLVIRSSAARGTTVRVTYSVSNEPEPGEPVKK
jgi:two-component system, NarL family, sensor kinase